MKQSGLSKSEKQRDALESVLFRGCTYLDLKMSCHAGECSGAPKWLWAPQMVLESTLEYDL